MNPDSKVHSSVSGLRVFRLPDLAQRLQYSLIREHAYKFYDLRYVPEVRDIH